MGNEVCISEKKHQRNMKMLNDSKLSVLITSFFLPLKEKGLESSLQNTQRLYSSQLQDLSQVIAGLEGELEQVRSGLATQRQRHSQLLNTKMKLEQEISTYRRLLDREEGR